MVHTHRDLLLSLVDHEVDERDAGYLVVNMIENGPVEAIVRDAAHDDGHLGVLGVLLARHVAGAS